MFLVLFEIRSHVAGWPGDHHIAEDGPELLIPCLYLAQFGSTSVDYLYILS